MPYGVDKKLGGDNPGNTNFVEDCVSKVRGTNKRTGKPYTKSEKVAICKTALRNKKEASEVAYQVESAVARAISIYMKTGKFTFDSAHAMSDTMLAKAGFDLDVYKELVLDK